MKYSNYDDRLEGENDCNGGAVVWMFVSWLLVGGCVAGYLLALLIRG
jgi:hypothetical protein